MEYLWVWLVLFHKYIHCLCNKDIGLSELTLRSPKTVRFYLYQGWFLYVFLEILYFKIRLWCHLKEHRFLSSVVCLVNYNSGASYALFQYLLLIIPHFLLFICFDVYLILSLPPNCSKKPQAKSKGGFLHRSRVGEVRLLQEVFAL